jgi:hypothetical protein
MTNQNPDRELFEKALGGWRGLLDSGLPAAVFLILYLVFSELNWALYSALAVGLVIFIIRIIKKESLSQVIAGFIGLAISVFITYRTNNAANFFLTGLVTNAIYAAVFAGSIFIKKPLLAYLIGALSGDTKLWLTDQKLRRVAVNLTWFWVGLFTVRLLVQLPLYFNQEVGWLGTSRLFMGWPLYLLAVYITYRIAKTARDSSSRG